MLNIAIVDDEKAVAEKLRSYVNRYFGETDCETDEYAVECFNDGIKFLSAPYNSYDIVFMDIKMPTMDGLAVAREFRKNNETACLIFVTNLADMAIRGYEVNALDFVVKPIDYADFKYRMSKAVRRVKINSKDSIVVLSNRVPVKIAVQSIIYVEIVYHRVIYHTVTGDIEEWGTMRDAEKRLRKYNFSRCNSGYLINLHYVNKVRAGTVHIAGTALSISRNRRATFMTDMSNYMGGG